MGGRNKGLAFEGLAAALHERWAMGDIRAVYLVGEAAQEILQALKAAGQLSGIRLLPGLEEVFADLPSVVEAGDTVLFSPACASFDRYEDYKHRGDHYRKLVEEYVKRRESGG